MRKLKTSSKGSQKSIEISGCSTQIGIESNQHIYVTDPAIASLESEQEKKKFFRKSNTYALLRKEHSNFKEVMMGHLLE
jgi:hypothetical protein